MIEKFQRDVLFKEIHQAIDEAAESVVTQMVGGRDLLFPRGLGRLADVNFMWPKEIGQMRINALKHSWVRNFLILRGIMGKKMSAIWGIGAILRIRD